MAEPGWKQLVAGWPWFRGPGRYPIPAYSEFMPPPRLGRKPYGWSDPSLLDPKDPWGWPVSEYEEAFQLRPGLDHLAGHIITALVRLARGEHAPGLGKQKLQGNPYWPEELADRAGRLRHERFVAILPLALSRTQDDKGRVRWTLFGNSELGPARGFWRGFFIRPRVERPAEEALAFLRRLLQDAYAARTEGPGDLHGAGFRILPADPRPRAAAEIEGPLPSWTEPFLLKEKVRPHGVRYLLTFRPFPRLPAMFRQAYLAGDLNLIPFPGSLLFWGAPPYQRLARELPLANQIPLLHVVVRCENPRSIRVPQSGWMHEPRPGTPGPDDQRGPVRNTYQRTHRWDRVHRHEDELAVLDREDKLAHVLFSTAASDLGLYGKPMARNCQLWTSDFHSLLDGPGAGAAEIDRAAAAVAGGGLFGYRFQFPAMRVGRHEVYWHRPLVAFWDGDAGRARTIGEAPLGFFTAYDAQRPDPARPVEMWPRPLRREMHVAAVERFQDVAGDRPHHTTINLRKLLETWELLGERPLPRSFARQLVTCSKHLSLEDWLATLPARAADPEGAEKYVGRLANLLEPAADSRPGSRGEPLTFDRTARRPFEVEYWRTIAELAHGCFINKDNADCVRDRATQKHLRHHHRDLEALGDFLLAYYERLVARRGMSERALVGDLPFCWRTEFPFRWSGGWLRNQDEEGYERNIMVVIPGRDRRRAVIMADHYDTAYMADHYEKNEGGDGARLAAKGADDNHSATAALMLGAPVFLDLSRAGRLGCDVWLVHLTGEEFPSDCLGARHLCQALVEGTLRIRLAAGGERDLSKVRVQGVYVLDMVAHNNDRDRDVFQISPGTGPESMWLALQAHRANEAWNAGTRRWNRRVSRRGKRRGRRSKTLRVPAAARHPELSGEVRPPYDPRSTLYNTDGQIFSDAGVPVVLFMENYDINRSGYHDSHDTLANIDLDYGAAVSAIAIEAVARAAAEKPPEV